MTNLQIVIFTMFVLKQVEAKARQSWYYNKLPTTVVYGFTLAEVLITLTIIGAVAALTIPSLVNNIGDQANRAAWKHTFSTFTQASMKMAADNGGDLSGLFGTDIANETPIRDSLVQYLNYTKKCDDNREVTDGCWHDSDKFYKFSGQVTGWAWNSTAGFILNNGTLVRINFTSAICDDTYASNNDGCGSINVDVNGFQGPNTVGKDIFGMLLLKNGSLAPAGTQNDYYSKYPESYGCNLSDADTQGWNCSAQYLYQ